MIDHVRIPMQRTGSRFGLLASVVLSFGIAAAVPAGAQVIYTSVPSPLPGNVVSIGPEAYSYNEIGDGLIFTAGSGRSLGSVKVIMSSFACTSGHWYGAINTPDVCITNPPNATFNQTITLNIYSVAPGRSFFPGPLLTTKTATFQAPYRPSTDARCAVGGIPGGDGTEWYNAADNTCNHGLAFPITFDFTSQQISLPDQIVASVTFNTTHSGYAPLGENTACFKNGNNCPYDYLNVSTEGSPILGANVDPTGIFVNWQNPKFSCSGVESGALELDSGCWPGLHPEIEVRSKAATAPTADSVTPNTGSGLTQTFTFKFSDANGFGYLNALYGLFNSSLSAAGGCIPVYLQSLNGIYLYNDAGNAVSGPLTPGSAGTLSNSQCTINGAGSTVSGSGNTLTVAFSITFKPAFKGLKTIYGYAANIAGLSSGFQTLGTFTPSPVINTPPTADSVVPNSGTGLNQAFTFKYSSANGYQYLNVVYALINSTLSPSGGCVAYYIQSTNSLYLYNDQGTGVSGPLTLGAAGSVSNSQCTISGPASSVSGSGNTLSLNLSVAFSPSVKTTQTIYGYALDNGNLNSGFQALGTFTPSPVVNTPPTADSVTPTSGSATTQTFTFKYSSVNGYKYLNVLYGLFNSSLSGVGGCFPAYIQSTNSLYLFSDSGATVTGPLTPGSGSISNSQCTINGAGVVVSGSGNTLTITLPITFSGTFHGGKSIFGYATDNGNLASGFQLLGSYTLP